MAEFQLQVFTQESKVLDQKVRSIVVPAQTGYLGVLAHHAPLVTLLGEGELTVIDPQAQQANYRIAGGFLEVHHNVATMLVDEFRQA